jgi:hypothetical protein
MEITHSLCYKWPNKRGQQTGIYCGFKSKFPQNKKHDLTVYPLPDGKPVKWKLINVCSLGWRTFLHNKETKNAISYSMMGVSPYLPRAKAVGIANESDTVTR